MKILLVLPAVEHLRVTPEKPAVPPRRMLRFSILPLTTVAALTPPEHEVRICDENVEPLDLAADVDLVGVSFMTALAPRAYEIAEAFHHRGVITVAGGFHPTFLPDEAAQYFDAVVVGDAEELWPRALQDAVAGRLQRIYRQVRPPVLARAPRPRRDLTGRTARHYATPNAVQIGRGCVHACRYCSITAFHGGSYRRRTVEDVVDELRSLPRDMMFVDDNIVADPDYARELFTAMLPLRKRWISQCSLKIADDAELLHLARRAGCRGLFIGIETISEENLAAVGKGFNDPTGYRRRLAAIRRAGIGVEAGLIVGLDRDDVHVFERTLEFCEHAGIDAIQVNILTPLPGTPLFEDFRRAGRIVDRDWSHYDFRHTVIRPARMSAAELQAGADWLYREFYRLPRIIRRTFRAACALGPFAAIVSWRLNMTYRFDNRREGIVGFNPAGARQGCEPRNGRSRRVIAQGTARIARRRQDTVAAPD